MTSMYWALCWLSKQKPSTNWNSFVSKTGIV